MTTIYITTTPYDGDAFPEAEHWDDFVADRIAYMYDARVKVTYGPKTTVSSMDESIDCDDIVLYIENGLWDDFCSQGYKAYTEEE